MNATVLRGVPVLDEAALEAVRKWVYTPTLSMACRHRSS